MRFWRAGMKMKPGSCSGHVEQQAGLPRESECKHAPFECGAQQPLYSECYWGEKDATSLASLSRELETQQMISSSASRIRLPSQGRRRRMLGAQWRVSSFISRIRMLSLWRRDNPPCPLVPRMPWTQSRVSKFAKRIRVLSWRSDNLQWRASSIASRIFFAENLKFELAFFTTAALSFFSFFVCFNF